MSFCKLTTNVSLKIYLLSMTPVFVLNPIKIDDNTRGVFSFWICDGIDYCARLSTLFEASDPFVFLFDLWSYIILAIRYRTPVYMETSRHPSEHYPDEMYISVDERTHHCRGYSRNVLVRVTVSLLPVQTTAIRFIKTQSGIQDPCAQATYKANKYSASVCGVVYYSTAMCHYSYRKTY